MQNLARKNLARLGLAERVEFKLRDINDGFDETGVDSLFLDVNNPYDYIRQARAALALGGFFGAISPTTNQVSRLLNSLYREHFAFLDVCEVLLRYYKPVPERLRPTDRMVAHTGFLVFARPMLPSAQLPPRAGPPGGEAEDAADTEPLEPAAGTGWEAGDESEAEA
jgi:tRNA (adenine57-N1/adenine58-N1)-methyltransferase